MEDRTENSVQPQLYSCSCLWGGAVRRHVLTTQHTRLETSQPNYIPHTTLRPDATLSICRCRPTTLQNSNTCRSKRPEPVPLARAPLSYRLVVGLLPICLSAYICLICTVCHACLPALSFTGACSPTDLRCSRGLRTGSSTSISTRKAMHPAATLCHPLRPSQTPHVACDRWQMIACPFVAPPSRRGLECLVSVAKPSSQ